MLYPKSPDKWGKNITMFSNSSSSNRSFLSNPKRYLCEIERINLVHPVNHVRASFHSSALQFAFSFFLHLALNIEDVKFSFLIKQRVEDIWTWTLKLSIDKSKNKRHTVLVFLNLGPDFRRIMWPVTVKIVFYKIQYFLGKSFTYRENSSDGRRSRIPTPLAHRQLDSSFNKFLKNYPKINRTTRSRLEVGNRNKYFDATHTQIARKCSAIEWSLLNCRLGKFDDFEFYFQLSIRMRHVI